MPDITLTIDGQEVTVPQGTGAVEAARAAGIEIPVFCHHPKLAPVGMCRMCLVEVGTPKMDPATRQPVLGEDGKPVIGMMPRLQTACTTPVSAGMVIKTNTAEVDFARRGVIEMLLTSHPLDCPVCIKGGECPLQNLTMGYGPGVSRFDYADKVHFDKPISLGPLIDLDRERCILCSRCVRFEDEIAGDSVLGFANRGRGWMIQSKSNPPFNSKFSGNTVDICPVGALMSHEFRFAGRVWEVKPVPSICPHCSVGCNVTLDMRYRDIKRVQPRENESVNEIWLCDRGRYGHHFVDSTKRLTKPLVRRNGVLVETTWSAAIEEIAQRLTGIKQNYPGNVVGGITSGRIANEDLFLFQKLIREQLGSPNLDCRTGAPDEADHDDLAYAFGVGTGTELGKLGKGTSVLVIGADPEEEAPVYVLRLRGIKRRGGDLLVANGRPTKLDASATHSARYRYGYEALFLFGVLAAIFEAGAENKVFANSRIKNLDLLRRALEPYNVATAAEQTGVSEATIRAIATSVAAAENLIVVYGRESFAAGTPLLQAIGNLLLVTGHVGKANNGALALLRYNNSRGALDLGVRPDKGPGYTNLAKPGLSAREMLNAVGTGKLRALYVVGSDPAAAYPAAAQALGKLDLLVVQDLFMTQTAEQADFVLPAASFAERDGTYTNAERRVQRFRQARDTVGESRPDWQIFATLGRTIAQLQPYEIVGISRKSSRSATAIAGLPAGRSDWNYRSTDEINAEITKTVPIYAGLTYSKLHATGGVWGRQPTNDAVFYDGTSYTNTEGYGAQWPSLAEQAKLAFDVVFSKPQPALAQGNQWTLVAVPRLYNDGTLMRDSELLRFWVAQPFVSLAQTDATRLGIQSGDRVRLTSSAGQIELFAKIDAATDPGLAFVPDLAQLPLAAVQTGVVTAVNIEKVA